MTPRFASALAIIAGIFGQGLTPPSTVTPSQWAARNLVLVDGPRSGQLWDPVQAPYICAILDGVFCGPYTKGTVRKSAQVGYTQGLTALAGWIACESPANALFVMQTSQMAHSLNSEKLQPAINNSPALKRRIFRTSKRDSLGSKALRKAFPGGAIMITGANSAAELQSRTIKYALCDEIDQWERDLNKQGSPMKMVDSRQIAFHATRDYRKLQGGTPTIKGASLVDTEFEAGDQRFQRLPCPHCGERIRLVFGGFVDEAGGTGLRFNRTHPYDAHYVAQCCGVRIEHWQKEGMIAAALDLSDYGFVAEKPEPGRYPSWHIDAISSNFTTWDKVAETYVTAGDDPQQIKSFYNHWLGLPYEEKTGVPDWEALFKRRESYAERVIPSDALIVTMAVDVQKRGLYVEIVGWTPNWRSYVIFAGYLRAGDAERPGDTSDPDDVCWKRLHELHATPLAVAHGGTRRIDYTGVDCRYNAPIVYDWVRRHHNAFAIRTVEGWGRPALSTPKLVDFDWRGKRIRQGVQQWQAGSYDLKAIFYSYLARQLSTQGPEALPPDGYCHFGSFLWEPYFRQITAEHVGSDKQGRRIWKQHYDDNHWLDCRIINMALAFGTAVGDIRNRSPETWRQLIAERGPKGQDAPLLQLVAEPLAAQQATQETVRAQVDETPAEAARDDRADAGGGWGFTGGEWL
jgi:phage terminase large subunit GpA-like protein